jgi:phage tail tape-measure protein
MIMTSTNVDSLRDSASDTLDKLQRAAAPAIKKGRRQVGLLLDEGGDLLERAGTCASETAADLGNSIIKYTKMNPLAALLLAAGAGALLISAARSIQSRR